MLTLLVFSSCGNFTMLEEPDFFIEKYDIDTSLNSEEVLGDKDFTYDSTPLINWTANDNAASYDFQLSETSTFEAPLLADIASISAPQYQVAAELPSYGRYYWRFRVNLEDGNQSSWYYHVFSFLSPELLEHFEDFNEGGFSDSVSWTFTRTLHPVITGEEAHDGFYSAQMGITNGDHYCGMETTVNIEEDSLLSFWYKTSGDRVTLRLDIDDESELNISYTHISTWKKYTAMLEPGRHTLSFSTENYHNDLAWIDSISIHTCSALDFTDDNFEENDSEFSTLNDWLQWGLSLPFIQNTEAYSGSKAVQLGSSDSTGDSFLGCMLKIDTTSTVSFYAKNTDGFGRLYFYIDDTEELYVYSDPLDWRRYQYILEPGDHMLKWQYDRSDDSDFAWLDCVTVSEVTGFTNDGFETADSTFSTLNDWNLGGDELPTIQSAKKYEGSNAVRFGKVYYHESSRFSIFIKLEQSSTLSFRLDKSGYYSDFYFYADESSVKKWDSSTSWEEYPYHLSAGVHKLEWRLSGDSYSNCDEVYVDSITITAD